jgi:hypothetical protein
MAMSQRGDVDVDVGIDDSIYGVACTRDALRLILASSRLKLGLRQPISEILFNWTPRCDAIDANKDKASRACSTSYDIREN